MDLQRVPVSSTSPVVVSGWLLLLCLVLTFLYPGRSLYSLFSYTIPALMSASTTSQLILLSIPCGLFIPLAIFSFIAGLKLWLVKSGAVSFAKAYLFIYLGVNVAFFLLWLVILRPHKVESIAAMAWNFVVGPIPSFALWYFYLENSQRVRSTYQLR